MPKRFFTSDTHFLDFRETEVMGEKIHLFFRPFHSAEEQDELLIENWNKLVNPEDEVWHLGDFTVKPEGLAFRKKLNGKIHLIRGNKDEIFTDQQLLEHFESVHTATNITLKNGEELHLVHYPVLAKTELCNLVGHIHKAWTVQPNMINVGVDVWNWTPIREEEIIHLLYAMRNYYDNDCFPAYLETNQANVKHLKKYATSYAKKL